MTTPINIPTVIAKHQTTLDASADANTKAWWEKYMKGVIPFRGVGIPKNRELLLKWRTENEIDRLSLDQQLDIALAFFDASYAEDKLAGILYLELFLYDNLPYDKLIPKFEQIYDKALIFDWNVCDWFCIRVLGPMIKHNGRECAQHIAEWQYADYLWKARSALVPFVKLTAESSYYPLVREISTTLIHRDERFAKTAVGWILRDISKHDPTFSHTFIDSHLCYFTKETLNNALKYTNSELRSSYLGRLTSVVQSL